MRAISDFTESSSPSGTAEQRIKDLHLQADVLRAEEELAARRHLLLIEKDTIVAASHKGYLSHEVLDRLMEDVDARLLALDSEG